MHRFLFLLCGFVLLVMPAFGQEVQVDVPRVVLTEIPFEVAVRGVDSTQAAGYTLRLGGEQVALAWSDEGYLRGSLSAPSSGGVTVEVLQGGAVVQRAETHALPGWVSILPPLLAIVIALLFKRVVPALFLGVWFGAWAVYGLTSYGLWAGLLDTFQVYVLQAFADPDHAAIILFSFMIGGMVGIISKNGGMQGVVNRITAWANTPHRGQLAASFLGLAIFFDDYANTLVVGNTMRPMTDRLRISREKLAYIVDSTAAPVACIAFVTTWIGYEVGLVGTAISQIPGYDESAYSVFLNSIPYSFYPLLAIFFVVLVAASRRDFGPMLEAEVRARSTGRLFREGAKLDRAVAEGTELLPKEEMPQRAFNAVIPVFVLIVAVLVGLYVTGEGDNLRDIIGSADAYRALLWASLLGVMTAFVLSIGQRILTIDETVEAWYAGLKAMLFAMIILLLAWSLSAITDVLQTAQYLVSVLGETLAPGIIPALVFVLAAAVAFATGTSWGTMGILMPLVVPLVWEVLRVNGMADPEHFYVIYSSVACVLSGSVWGDHCSPISDTTILSSMASGCDHVDHVRTQLPYAFSVGTVAILLGTLPTGFGFSPWISLLLGAAVLYTGMRLLGKRAEDVVTT